MRPYGRSMLFVVVCVGLAFPAGAGAQDTRPADTPDDAAKTTPVDQDIWRLAPRDLPLRLDIRGWVDFGITFNRDNPPSHFNGVMQFNDREDQVVVNQVYLVIERPTETQDGGFDIGFRFDAFWGTDSRFVEALGMGQQWNNDQEFYGFCLPQMYVEAAWGNLSVQVGRFYTIAGYERVPAPDNFFYSHSYAMAYAQPFTHTGVMASYDLDVGPLGTVTFIGGIDRGWDIFCEAPDNVDLGSFCGVEWQNDWGTTGWDSSVAFAYLTGHGPANPFIPGLEDDHYVYTLVASQTVFDRVTYVFEYFYGKQQTGSPFDGSDAPWYGYVHHVYVTLTEQLSVGFRCERFRDAEGSRVGGFGRRIAGSPIVPFGFAGDFQACTVGLQYRPHPNVRLRAEARFDKFEGVSGFGPRPFNDGQDDTQTTFAIDCLIEF